MTLTEIEYGSIASSEIMNNNFNYLESRISGVNESVTTSISSLASNIATINSRLTELASDLEDIESELNLKIETYRAKTKLLAEGNSMLPSWSSLVLLEISDGESYTAETNCGLLFVPAENAAASITMNGKALANISYPIILPAAEGDVFAAVEGLGSLYLLPQKEFSIEGF